MHEPIGPQFRMHLQTKYEKFKSENHGHYSQNDRSQNILLIAIINKKTTDLDIIVVYSITDFEQYIIMCSVISTYI